jgi:hypothetical protein
MFLGLAEGAMIFAHDAAKVAVVRVGIEGDSPRAWKGLNGQCTTSIDGMLIDGDHVFGMLANLGDIPGVRD